MRRLTCTVWLRQTDYVQKGSQTVTGQLISQFETLAAHFFQTSKQNKQKREKNTFTKLASSFFYHFVTSDRPRGADVGRNLDFQTSAWY